MNNLTYLSPLNLWNILHSFPQKIPLKIYYPFYVFSMNKLVLPIYSDDGVWEFS